MKIVTFKCDCCNKLFEYPVYKHITWCLARACDETPNFVSELISEANEVCQECYTKLLDLIKGLEDRSKAEENKAD